MMFIFYAPAPEVLHFRCDTPSRGIASAVIFPTETRLNRQKNRLQLRLWFHGRPSTNHHSHKGIGGSVHTIGTDRKKADTQHHQR